MPLPLLPIALGIGAAASAYGQSKASGRAADISEAQLEFLKQKYAEQEPLRALGLSRLQSPLPERPDQGAAFADPSNPFYKPPQALGFGKGYTNQMPDLDKSLTAYRETGQDVQQNQRRVDAKPTIEALDQMDPRLLKLGNLGKTADKYRQSLGL